MLKRREAARKILGAASIAFVTYLAQAAWAGDVYVDISGRYWPWAYKTIQVGIDAASDGDTVQVMGMGLAYPGNIHFHGKNIVVTAVGSPTYIQGGGDGPTVTFAGTEGETCALQGFIIQGGVADNGGGICGGDKDNHTHATIADNVIVGNRAENGGGGIAYCDGDISGNTIAQNHAGDSGGGLYECDGTIFGNRILANLCDGRGGGLHFCDGSIQNNEIRGNSAFGRAGGLYHCNGPIENNTISGNSAGSDGGGLHFCGEIIQNNTISGNSAGDQGGGLYNCFGTIQNNTIVGNSAQTYGGGLMSCDGIIQNSTIIGNSAGYCGGGLAYFEGTIRNNTISGNSSVYAGDELYNCHGTIRNCILWAKKGAFASGLQESSIPTYSCIRDWNPGGEGNIVVDPQFVDPDGPDNDPETYEDNDYHLVGSSPCIDKGKNEDWMADAVDLDGNPRILDGDGDGDPVVDMGAYEYGEAAYHPCDDNQDLTIDDWELLWAIEAWAGNERMNGWPKNLDDYDWALLELIELWAKGTEYDPEAIVYGDP